MSDEKQDQRLLSMEDVERGWKDITVRTLDGRSIELRLTAPDWRRRRELVLLWAQSQDFGVFVIKALPKENRSDAFLNTLDPESIARLETMATVITLGEDTVKKILAEAVEMMNRVSGGADSTASLPTASASKAA